MHQLVIDTNYLKSCWNRFNIVAVFYVQLQISRRHWSLVIFFFDIPTSKIMNQIQITKQRLFACLPCTILIRDPIAQISATKSEMPAPVNFNSCLRPSSCTLSYPISVSKGCSGFSKFPVLLRYLYVFPISLIKDVVDSCILFAVIEN